MKELLKISSVLTEEYLSQKLSEWFNRDVVFTRYQNAEISVMGSSYLSDLFRICFFGKILHPKGDEEPEVYVNVIIKGFPKNIGRRKTFRSSEFFENEINFYEKVMPTLLKFQSEKKMSDPFVNIPRLFAAASNDVDDFVALEDLGILGYRGAERQKNIDYPHCLSVIGTFAKFHALSLGFKDQHPGEYVKLANCIKETYFSEKYWDWYKNFYRLLCLCAIDAVEKECPGTIYAEKIREFARDETYMRVAAATQANPRSSVISHGDSWTPNFLFKYKEGSDEPVNSMLIDFQITRSASPVLDIGYIIYAAASEELRDEHYHDMLKHYHDVLSRQIREMGSDPEKVYSWEYFMQEVKEYSFYGVSFSFESTPLVILPEEEAFDLNSITGTDPIDIAEAMNVKPIKTKEGRQRLVGIVKHAVDNGYI